MSHEYPAIAQGDDDTITFFGTYPVNQTHSLSGLLNAALQSFEASAQKIAIDSIQDNRARQEYIRHISEIPKLVRAEIDLGHVGLLEGVRFAQMLRNQVMQEARAATSAGGLAIAVRSKSTGRTQQYLLERYSVLITNQSGRSMHSDELEAYVDSIVEGRTESVFKNLTTEQRTQVYYNIIDAAGRDKASFSTASTALAAAGKVFCAMTAILAIYSVATANDKLREANRHAALVTGSLLGGALADMAVSSICGPGAPICAFVTIAVGSLAGSALTEKVNDMYQAELEEFAKWKIR